jgi:SAM-dependent methyltransferase
MSDDAGRRWLDPPVGDATFDAYYFAHCCGKPYRRDEHWTRFFWGIADHIVSGIQPKHVLDAGCGLGLLVEALRGRGVDAEGIDLSSHAIANVFEPIKPFCKHGSIADEFAGRYDLIVSIEVVEHMPAREAEGAVANMCRHSDDVLFSSSPLDYREPSHVNVQPPEHWAELFARQGFYRDVDFDASFITPWAVRFRRSSEPLPRIVRSYERRSWALTFESKEARAFAMDIQRQLADTSERLSAAERRVVETESKLGAVEGELARVQGELARALGTIHDMERSAFWKLRRLWTSVNRLVGRST